MDRKTIERKLIDHNERAADVRTSGRQERKLKNERRTREAEGETKMESERCKCEKMIRNEMNWINNKIDRLLWEIKSLQNMQDMQDIQTPPANYLAVITVSMLSSALISFLFYMLSK